MKRDLTTVDLRDGNEMQVVEVCDKDPDWAERILPFLHHKPEPYYGEIRRALEGEHVGVTTRFYLGVVGDELVGNVTTVERDGVGWMGHVYTVPNRRGQGIAGALIRVQTEDFRMREGRALFLSTTFDSVAFHLYTKYGYRSLSERDGRMELILELDFYRRYFEVHTFEVRPPSWADQPGFCALCAEPSGEYVRSVLLKLYGRSTTEADYFRLMAKTAAGAWDARLAVGENGAVLGFAVVGPNSVWTDAQGPSHLLDIYAHPEHRAVIPALLADLPLPGGDFVAPIDPGGKREALLCERGFRKSEIRRHGAGGKDAGDREIALWIGPKATTP